jgi:hypothetical protein
MKLSLASKSAADSFNKSITSERLVNVYPVPAPLGAQAMYELRSCPGLRAKGAVPGPFFRAFRAVEGVLYAVSKGELLRINADGTVAHLADVASDENTSMAGHRSNVTIAAGGNYYVWDGTSISQPGSGRFTSEGSVAFLNQFTLLSELDGREVEWTVVGDPTARNALYFATAEGRDDKNVRLIDSGANFIVFKQQSLEIWGSAGAAESAFARIEGGVIETGLKEFNLVAKGASNVFFIGHDNVAYIMRGAELQPVSTPAINQRLKRNDPTNCFYYEDRGSQNYVIRYADRPADVFDLATGIWHERSTGVNHAPWDIIAAEFCYGEWYLADRSGGIFTLGIEPHDNSQPMRRTIVPMAIYLDGEDFTVWEFELLGRFGVSTITESGPNLILDTMGQPITDEFGEGLLAQAQDAQDTTRGAKIWLRVSRDGYTWGAPKTREVGRSGETELVAMWRALGSFRKFVVEINMTDPVEMPLLSDANVVVG